MKWSQLTVFSKALLILAFATLTGAMVYYLSPGLRVEEAKSLRRLSVATQEVNNLVTAAQLPLPGREASRTLATKPLIRIGGYAWNAQSGLIVANGGAKTTRGSLLERQGVHLEIVRQDWLSELRNLQLKFVEEFDRGEPFPRQGVAAIMIMGDGAPFYISSAQQALDERYGKGKYQLQVLGAIGLSYGEDKLIGPPAWKTSPQTMKGALVSAVIGDGDWVTTVNYAFANGLKVNPDPSTYDADAVNFLASANDDYTESAKELIKSRRAGWTVPLREVKNGKLTGRIIQKKVDGCATWTPGDKMVFDALTGFTDVVSTREFNNQMAAVLIFVKQWAEQNRERVGRILEATHTAANQMKQYDAWRQKAAETAAETFALETPAYWYRMFEGQAGEKNGIAYRMGGSRVFNLADARQYFGLTDGTNRYKAVYDQVSRYLQELNPAGFNQHVARIVPYEEAVNLSFLGQLKDVEGGSVYLVDYSQKATTVVASGEWRINFQSGRAALRPESKDVLAQIYNLLVQAEVSKLELVGHTDDTGNAEDNYALSAARAEAVKSYLIGKGIPAGRFQRVDGKGQDEPVADNATPAGKAQNRRVVVTLLK